MCSVCLYLESFHFLCTVPSWRPSFHVYSGTPLYVSVHNMSFLLTYTQRLPSGTHTVAPDDNIRSETNEDDDEEDDEDDADDGAHSVH